MGSLNAAHVPVLRPQEWGEVVRVASGRLTGRTPRRIDDPMSKLADLAGRVPNGPGRVRLEAGLMEQAAWLVASRVGVAGRPMPAFDPAGDVVS